MGIFHHQNVEMLPVFTLEWCVTLIAIWAMFSVDHQNVCVCPVVTGLGFLLHAIVSYIKYVHVMVCTVFLKD